MSVGVEPVVGGEQQLAADGDTQAEEDLAERSQNLFSISSLTLLQKRAGLFVPNIFLTRV